MDDNKYFLSQYIMRIIITISLNSTKALKLCCYYDTENFSDYCDNSLLILL